MRAAAPPNCLRVLLFRVVWITAGHIPGAYRALGWVSLYAGADSLAKKSMPALCEIAIFAIRASHVAIRKGNHDEL